MNDSAKYLGWKAEMSGQLFSGGSDAMDKSLDIN